MAYDIIRYDLSMNFFEKSRITEALTFSVVCLGLYESVFGLMQLFGLAESRHPMATVTGDFYNSGPYGCFLSVIFPIAFRWALCRDRGIRVIFGTGMVLSCAVLIPITMSRTAFVAAISGGVVAVYDRIQIRGCSKIRLLVVAVAAAAAGIFLLKPASAFGRLLMWKVAAHAAAKVPVGGVGWSKVAGTYGEAQEHYFADGNGSEIEAIVAGTPEYVFNEYLQVAIAFGVPAAILLTVFVFGGILTAMRSGNFGFAGGSTAIAVVMFASYPLQFPSFVVVIALILAGAWLSSSSEIVGLGAVSLIAVALALFLTHNDTKDIRHAFSSAHAYHRVGDYDRSNEILLSMLPHTSDPMVLNIIGKNYRELGKPDSAEYYFRKSVNRCPNRHYPHYLLMNLYGDSICLDPAKQRKEAMILIYKKEKVPSPAVDDMRKEARRVLDKLNGNTREFTSSKN